MPWPAASPAASDAAGSAAAALAATAVAQLVIAISTDVLVVAAMLACCAQDARTGKRQLGSVEDAPDAATLKAAGAPRTRRSSG